MSAPAYRFPPPSRFFVPSRALDVKPSVLRRRRLVGAAMMAALCAVTARPARADWPSSNLPIAAGAVTRARAVSISDGAGGEIVVFEEDYRGSVDLYAQRLNSNGVRQWGSGSGVAICTAAQSQRFPAIVSDGVGGAIITWQDARAGNSDIYVQRINPSGVAQWTANGVALCTAANGQTFPAIAADGSSGAIVTWLDGRSGTSTDVYARRVNAGGTPQWAADGVSICTATANQSNAAIVTDGAGGAIIGWQDPRSGAGSDDIYAQRVNGAGTTQWIANGLVISNAAGAQEGPAMIADGASGATLAWHDHRAGNYDVYAQRVTSGGSILWTANGVALCVATGDQGFPALVTDGAGGAVAAWDDGRDADLDIYAQRVGSSGTIQWTVDGVVVCGATGAQTSPHLVPDGTGGAVAAWSDLRGGVDYDVYAGRINGSGTAPWTSDGVVLSDKPGNPVGVDVVPDGFGGAVATWDDLRSASDVYARRVDNSGVPMWTDDGVRVVLAIDDQTSPSMAPDGAGGTIVVWQESFRGTSDLYAQRVNASGVLQWAANGVPVCVAAGSQFAPVAVSDGSGGAIIAWHDDRNAPEPDVYAQRINSAGGLQWTAAGVALSTAAGFQYFPAIVSDGLGGAIVVWTDTRNGNYDVYGRRVSSAGAPLWTADGLGLCVATGDQLSPSIDTDGSGGVIAVWEDHRGASADIYAKRVNASGTLQWAVNGVAVCAAANDQTVPRLVADGAGGAIVTWQDMRNSATTVADIYAQRISGAGASQWTADGVPVSDVALSQSRPSITTDQAGGAIIAWNDLRNGSTDIYAQRLNGSGSGLWTADGVALCTDPAEQGNTVPVTDGANGAIVLWSDLRYGLEEDVFVRYLTAAGAPQGPANGQAVAVEPGRQVGAAMISDGAGGAFAAWQDARNGSGWDIYAHRIIPSGPVPVPIVPMGGVLALDPAFPNPTADVSALRFRLPHRARVSLAIYDLQGRRVRGLLDERREAGEGRASWDGRDDAGRRASAGVYLCRLEADGTRVSRRLVKRR
jgi:hypothetical protein